MKAGHLAEGFVFLPSVHLSWYYFNGKRHYYWGASWLFWYVTTLDKFEWEE